MTTYTGSISDRYTTIHFDVSLVSQNQSQNTSNVSYKFYIKGKSGTGFYDKFHTGTVDIYVNGTHPVAKKGLDFDTMGGKTQVLASGNYTVSHDNNGNGGFDFSGWMSAPASNISGKVAATFNLPKIQRGATITANPAKANIGDRVTFRLGDTNSAYRYTIRYDMTGDKAVIADKISGSSYTWTIPAEWGTKYLSNLESSWATIYVDTYNGNTAIATHSTRLTVSIPDGVAPTIEDLYLSEQNTTKKNIFGDYNYYQLLSIVKAEASITTDYGASISSCQMTLGGKTETGTAVTFSHPDLSGRHEIVVSVVDSRGRSASRSFSIDFLPYAMPSIDFFAVARLDNNDTIADSTVKISHTVTSESYDRNGLSVTIELQPTEGDSWETVHSATVNQSPYSYNPVIGDDLEAFQSYTARLTIKDKFYTATALATLPASAMPLVIGATDPVVGIGKIPNITKGLDIKGQLFVNGEEIKPAVIPDIPEITSGTNGNGRWIKFPDGTLICHKTDFRITYANHWYLRGYWTFPQKFKESATVIITGYNPYDRPANRGAVIFVKGTTTTSADIQMRANLNHQDYTSSDDTTISVVAIGRWK